MKHLLPCLLLLTPVVAPGQSNPVARNSGLAGVAAPVTPGTAAGFLPAESQFTLAGTLGFRSLYYLMNRSAWPTLPHDGAALRSGPAVIDLADPLQAIVIFNAWHLRAAHGATDSRLADLRKHVLRTAVVFSSTWPDYTPPGFVVLIQKRNHEWALVARLANQYLIEDRSGIGVCIVSMP